MSTEATENGRQEAAAETEPIAATDVAEITEAAETAETAAITEADKAGQVTGSDEDDRATGVGGANEVTGPDSVDEVDEVEPTDLIAMAEPVELAEPVDDARPRRWPRVLLAVGFVVAAVAIVAGAIAIVGSVTHGFKKPVKIIYKKSALFSLKTGECFDPKGQSYSLIPCNSPHVAEVFATFALTGTKWPGDAAIAAKVSGGCASLLNGYLNPGLAISLAPTYVYPDSVAWQAGTRTVICEVRATSGELTGSVRGATATAG
jgi:hypothetical protein